MEFYVFWTRNGTCKYYVKKEKMSNNLFECFEAELHKNLKSKMTSRGTGHFRRRYFVFNGCSKNYIMYWGVTSIIIAQAVKKVCTKITKCLNSFWAI